MSVAKRVADELDGECWGGVGLGWGWGMMGRGGGLGGLGTWCFDGLVPPGLREAGAGDAR